MKLIVDIAKEKYNQIINSYQGSNVRPKDYEIAIINGIPLDKIRDEIDVARFIDKDTKLCKNANASGLEVAIQIIDKYRESEARNEKG